MLHFFFSLCWLWCLKHLRVFSEGQFIKLALISNNPILHAGDCELQACSRMQNSTASGTKMGESYVSGPTAWGCLITDIINYLISINLLILFLLFSSLCVCTMWECGHVRSVNVDIRWQLSGLSSLLPQYVLRSKLGSSYLQGKQLHSLSHFAGLNL